MIRGQKVMIDADLATLYGVATKRLSEQVKRNIDRFPADFMFQLSPPRQIEVSKALPFAFIELSARMAASVLNTPRAGEVSWCARSRRCANC